MEERIYEILEMYSDCFKDLDLSPICPETFVIEFNINPEMIKESLIAMDRKIYRQKNAIRDLCLSKTYPNDKENLRILYKRLNNVHEEIYDILRDELGVCECWIDQEKDELDFPNAP